MDKNNRTAVRNVYVVLGFIAMST